MPGSIEQNYDLREAKSLLAWNLGKLLKYEEALTLLQEIEKEGREDAWLYNEMGWEYGNLEKFEEALRYYKKAKAKTPSVWTDRQIAYCTGSAKHHVTAIAQIKRLLKSDPNDGWLLATLGWNFLQLKFKKMALRYYRESQKTGYNTQWLQNEIKDLE